MIAVLKWRSVIELLRLIPAASRVKDSHHQTVLAKVYEMDVIQNSRYSNHKALITQFREGQRFMRIIASIVLCCFAVVFYSPAVNAAVNTIDDYLSYKPAYPVFGEMNTALASTQKLLKQLSEQLVQLKIGDENSNKARRVTTLQQAISEQREKFENLDSSANDYFEEQVNYYSEKQLPQATIAALQQRQQHYQREMSTLQQQLQRVSAASGNLLVSETRLTTAMLERLYQPLQHPYDSDLPFGALEAISGAPVQTSDALLNLLGEAVSGDPVNKDTEATIDTQLTEAIIAKAAELNNDSVEIYNWVKNNVEYIPSYGSLQGADYTLQTLRGNAFDQSSLMIALLRASNIPARYQYGTMVITNHEAMNWVGGVREPAAVQNLMSQGGIPVARLSINNINDFITLEHIWVQVWDGNRWIEVDPSFKQYNYTQGMDLQSQIAFDAENFVTTLQSSATVNETEGWVQNVNQAFIETELEDNRQALEAYLTNQQPEATVGDVIGSKQIIQTEQTELPASLPYERVIVSQAITAVPDSLRYKFTFALQDTFGGELLSHTASTIELAGKSLAVSFNPATAADEQALLDYLPDNPQSAAELPSIIPSGLMNVVGEFTLNGEVAASSAAMSFGQVLQTEKGYYFPGRGWSTTVNPIITGEYQAIGLDYHGLSPKQLAKLQAQLENTKTQIEAEDYNGLTKHSVVGDLMQSAVMSYMAITDVQSKLAAQSSDMVYYREPSYGTFQTNAKTNGLLGTVANVEMTGLLMDMDSMKFSTECKSNCWGKWRDFNQQMGSTYSAYEHLVPEQLFSTEDEPVEGVSAVKALAIASQQGQRIYTFTQDNLSYLSHLTIDQGTKDEIQAQVSAGMVATVHQHPITYAGWSGVGYTIIDPDTGAGGFKISGGSDGFQLVLALLGGTLFILGIYLSGGVAATSITLVGGAFIFLGIVSAILSVVMSENRAQAATMAGIFVSLIVLPTAVAIGGVTLFISISAFILAFISGLPI